MLQTLEHHQQLLQARLRMQGDTAHHMERVVERNGVVWLNHSIATSFEMVAIALKDIPQNVVVILGGVDRFNEHHVFAPSFHGKVTGLVCLGSTRDRYFKAFGQVVPLIVSATTLTEAIQLADKIVMPSTRYVLFAPGCPSYDAFDNYKNRGDEFKRVVKTTFM
jgi:UDP-N-acetylmuramoylalanine--D-glutamate ligase